MFITLMIITFLAAVATLLFGVVNMGRPNSKSAPKIMALRVGICGLLLAEMLVYAFFF